MDLTINTGIMRGYDRLKRQATLFIPYCASKILNLNTCIFCIRMASFTLGRVELSVVIDGKDNSQALIVTIIGFDLANNRNTSN